MSRVLFEKREIFIRKLANMGGQISITFPKFRGSKVVQRDADLPER
jgi:ribonuclease HIII